MKLFLIGYLIIGALTSIIFIGVMLRDSDVKEVIKELGFSDYIFDLTLLAFMAYTAAWLPIFIWIVLEGIILKVSDKINESK